MFHFTSCKCSTRSLSMISVQLLNRRLLSTKTTSDVTSSGSNTIKEEKVSYYDGMAQKWRSTPCVKAGLEFRVEFITNGLLNRNPSTSAALKANEDGSTPLKGIKLIDVGCGAGMVSEAMCNLGATVTGIDPAVHMVQVAKQFAEQAKTPTDRLQYWNETTDDHVKRHPATYDALLVMTILEHIKNHRQFLENCVQLLKPHGSIFIHHINKTWSSIMLFEMWGGRIAKVAPKGAVTYEQLMRTGDIVDILKSLGCHTVDIRGSRMTLSGGGTWTNSKKFGNFIHAIRQP